MDGIAFQFVAESVHVHLERLVVDGFVVFAVASDVRHDFCSRTHAAGGGSEMSEEIKLLQDKLDPSTVHLHRAGREVDSVWTNFDSARPFYREPGGSSRSLPVPESGFQPGIELAKAEGLWDEVAGAELEAEHDVELFGYGREDDDGNVALSS